MSTFKIGHDATLSMVVEIEADSAEEAMAIFADKWSNDENFARNFCMMAPIVDENTYDLTDTPYPPEATPIEKMC